MSDSVDVPVLIVGAGPVGVTIANLLGTYGTRTLIIDRSPEVLDFPVRLVWTTRPCARFRPSAWRMRCCST